MGKKDFKADSNGYVSFKDVPLSEEGVYMYSGKVIGDPTLNPDELYPVFRPKEELEKAVSGFEQKPFLYKHEMVGDGDDRYTKYDNRPAGGVLSNVKMVASKMIGDISVWSESVKDKIKNGIRELSLGYTSKYEPSKGNFKGKAYDYIQKNLVGNHLALVENGRMGSEMSLDNATFDSANLTYDSIELTDMDKENTEDMSDYQKELIAEMEGLVGDIENKDKKNAIIKKAKELALNKSFEKKTEDEEDEVSEDEFIDRGRFNKRFTSKADQDWADKTSYKRNQTKDEVVFKKTKSSKTGFVTKKTGENDKMADEDKNKEVEAGETGDEAKTDKRKGISEVEAMLYEAKKDPSKLTDELIKTIAQKMENNSYEGSEKSDTDDEGEGEEESKGGEEEATEDKSACTMDEAEIAKKVRRTIRDIDNLGKRLAKAGVSVTYDSLDTVEELATMACKKLKIDNGGNSIATINGYLGAVSSKEIRYTMDHKEINKQSSQSVQEAMAKLYS